MAMEKKKSSKKIKICEKYVAKKIPIDNHFNKDDSEKRITDSLFKVIHAGQSEIKSIHVFPGDSIRGDDKRLYIVQESRKPIPATTPPIRVKSTPTYQLIPYPYYRKQKVLTFKKGISAQDFIRQLTNEVNKFLEIKENDSLFSLFKDHLNGEYVSKQFHGETISREDRKRRRVFNELFSASRLIENKRQLVCDLISILQNSIDKMDSARIILHYLRKILFATGIEKGSLEDIKL
jgi:hypothetical protein